MYILKTVNFAKSRRGVVSKKFTDLTLTSFGSIKEKTRKWGQRGVEK